MVSTALLDMSCVTSGQGSSLNYGVNDAAPLTGLSIFSNTRLNDNVLTLKNLQADLYCAIRCLDVNGQERTAFGYGNLQGDLRNGFSNSAYIEISNLNGDSNKTHFHLVNTKTAGNSFDQWSGYHDGTTLFQCYPGWETSPTASIPSLVIDGSNGNVGINTSGTGSGPNVHPQYLLDVNVLDGTSNKIRVANTTSNGNGAAGSISAFEAVGIRGDSNGSFEGRLGAAFVRTDGTAIASGAAIGAIAFGAQYGTATSFTQANLLYPASIKGMAEGNFSASGAMATGLAFFTGVAGDDLTTANKTYGTERMRIDNTGKVGIGLTTGITNLFELSGAGGTSSIKVLNSGVGAVYLGFDSGGVLGTDQGTLRLVTGISSNSTATGTTRVTITATTVTLANNLDVPSIPTADPHVAGRAWSNLGIMTVSAG